MPDDDLTRLRALREALGILDCLAADGCIIPDSADGIALAKRILRAVLDTVPALLDRVARAEEANATKDRACDEALIELEKAWRERDDARTALAAMTAERDGLPRPRYEAMQADLRRLMAERDALATLARELAHGLRVLRVTCDTAGFPLAGKAADDLLARAATLLPPQKTGVA